MAGLPATVNVTKRTPTPPKPSPRRRSRVPEINALLGRWNDPANLFPWERDYLIEHGFGLDLEAARKRPPKLSVKAKVKLLRWHLAYRAWDVRKTGGVDREHYSPSTAHGLLLQWGEHEAAAVETRGRDTRQAWRALRENTRIS